MDDDLFLPGFPGGLIRAAYGVVFAAIFVVAISATRAADPETIVLTRGIASEPYKIDTEKPFKTIKIGDPKIVDVRAQGNRTIILDALAVGATNIIFLDEGNVPIKNLGILVNEAGPSRVLIHNKALLTSATIFRCWTAGCQYVEELTVTEPAPLPRGYSNSNLNSNINSTTH